MPFEQPRFFHFGPFIFDLIGRTLTNDAEQLEIEPRHYSILKRLIEKRPEPVRCTDPELIETFSSSPSTDQKHMLFTKYISELRSILKDESGKYILTLDKRDDPDKLGGYKFIAEVISDDAQSSTKGQGKDRASQGNQFSLCPIFTKFKIDEAIGTVEERFEKALNEVWISGNDNAFVAKSLSPTITRALRKGRKIRLMAVDPDSPAAAMLSLIDPRFEGNTFKREIGSMTEIARDWRKSFPENFEYKLLPILPALGFFITDPALPSKTVKIEIYTAKPWEPLDSRPHIVFNEDMPEWREYFIMQFKNYWDLSNSPFA